MPTALTSRRLLADVLCRLVDQYGRRSWESHGPPVDVLIGTILSQSTSRANSRAGYRRLVESFSGAESTWDAAADVPVGRIERCIRVSGLSRQKAPRIRKILRDIRAERGAIDLAFLGDATPAAAFEYLCRFKGVGPSTLSQG